MAISYTEALPASFTQKLGSDPALTSAFSSTGFTYDSTFEGAFGIDTEGKFNFFKGTGVNALKTDPGWTFITAPDDISWNVNNQADRVNIFGTNSPPVVAGTRGMRDLSLNNSLVEGFVRRVTVEDKIFALEQLMNYSLNPTDGFVQVPVYQVWANEKAYSKGYFIIKDIKVQEKMRDLKGNATRATVDISFMEVPEYQVNSGRDLASQPAAAATARALPDRNATQAAQEAAQKAAVNGKVDKGVNAATKAGPGAGSAKPANTGFQDQGILPGTGTELRPFQRRP